MSLHFGYAGHVRRLEAQLVQELALTPIRLPPELSQLSGVFREAPAVLQARAYRGERVRYARFVELAGEGLEIGNVLCLADEARPLPVLGMDLVAVGKESAIAVADLSPTTARNPLNDERCKDLRERLTPTQRFASAGELPGWAAEWFSPQALFARITTSESAALLALLQSYAEVFVALLERTAREPELSAQVRARQDAYSTAHRQHDRGLTLLTRMFDPQLAARFLHDVLFPERIPT